MSDVLELALQTIISQHVGVEESNPGLLEKQSML